MNDPLVARRAQPVRVVRIISRLNVGGPAIQAIALTKLLEPLGYRTTLVRGREDPQEGSMDYLAERMRVDPLMVPWLRRNPGMGDLSALPALIRELRRARPQIVHTHAAKAGALGRLAALLAFRGARRPVLVHTYHGHSLSGYFSGMHNAAFLRIERVLGRRTDRLVAVSEEVRDELISLGVASRKKFEVVPVGFDFSSLLAEQAERSHRRAALRTELGIPHDARVLTLVSRLVPIKRVDRFLRIAMALSQEPGVRFLIVGDGELRAELQASSQARALADRVVWTGLRRDMPEVYFASDLVIQTSDNEGTPVALIEAQAAGLPVVSTRVGGVSSAVRDGQSGQVLPPGDEAALAEAARAILLDPQLAGDMGARGRRHVVAEFSQGRLLADIDALYTRLLSSRTKQPYLTAMG